MMCWQRGRFWRLEKLNIWNLHLCLLDCVLTSFFVFFLPPSLSQIQLALGPESSIAVGWKMKDVKMSGAGELKVHMWGSCCLSMLKLFFQEEFMIKALIEPSWVKYWLFKFGPTKKYVGAWAQAGFELHKGFRTWLDQN